MGSNVKATVDHAHLPYFIGWEVAIIFAEVVAMACLRTAAKGTGWGGPSMNHVYTALGVLSYCFVALVFRKILRYAPLSLANAVWDAGAIVLTTALGLVVYKEKFKPVEYLGLALAVGALACMLVGAMS